MTLVLTDDARPIAARYLAVHLEPLPVSRRARLGHRAWAVAFWLLPAPLDWLSDPEPKVPTRLLITRRCDGAILATFDHDHLTAAIAHRDDLSRRLQTMHIFDVCRQVSIDVGQVGTPVNV